jgi:hypothetical protein
VVVVDAVIKSLCDGALSMARMAQNATKSAYMNELDARSLPLQFSAN